MNADKMKDLGIKAFKVELTKRAYKKKCTYKNADGEWAKDASGKFLLREKDIPESTWTEYWTPFLGEVVDYGECWNYGGGCVYIYTDDGFQIEEGDSICERMDIDTSFLEDECGKAGDWACAEVDCPNGEFIKVTALGEMPRISVEKTIDHSDLCDKQMARVRIYGDPLLKPMTLLGNNILWMPNFNEDMNNLIRSSICDKFGNCANIMTPIKFSMSEVSITLCAMCREGIVNILRDMGCVNPEDVKIKNTVGDEVGVKRVTAVIHIHTEL